MNNNGMPQLKKELILDVDEGNYIDTVEKLSSAIKPYKLYKNKMLTKIHQLKLASLSRECSDTGLLKFCASSLTSLLEENEGLREKSESLAKANEGLIKENKDLLLNLTSTEDKFDKFKKNQADSVACLKKSNNELVSSLKAQIAELKGKNEEGQKKVKSLFENLFESDKVIAALKAKNDKLHELNQTLLTTLKNKEFEKSVLTTKFTKAFRKEPLTKRHGDAFDQPNRQRRESKKDRSVDIRPVKEQTDNANSIVLQRDVSYQSATKISILQTDIATESVSKKLNSMFDDCKNDKADDLLNIQPIPKRKSVILEKNFKSLSLYNKLLSLLDSRCGYVIASYLPIKNYVSLLCTNKSVYSLLSFDRDIIKLHHVRSMAQLQKQNEIMQQQLKAFELESLKHEGTLKKYFIYKLLYKKELPTFFAQFETELIDIINKLDIEEKEETPQESTLSFFSRLKNSIPTFSTQDLVK